MLGRVNIVGHGSSRKGIGKQMGKWRNVKQIPFRQI